MSTDLTTVEQPKFSVAAVIERLDSVQELMRKAMQPKIDYGTIPGTNKPTRSEERRVGKECRL